MSIHGYLSIRHTLRENLCWLEASLHETPLWEDCSAEPKACNQGLLWHQVFVEDTAPKRTEANKLEVQVWTQMTRSQIEKMTFRREVVACWTDPRQVTEWISAVEMVSWRKELDDTGSFFF